MSTLSGSVSETEVARFSAQADEWWTPRGAFRALHELGPLRLRYIEEQIVAPLEGLRVLDVGCGGGLMAETLAWRGAKVVGIDASEKAIAVARAHAEKSGLSIDYRVSSAESLAKTGEQFDLILALEIVEHVADISSFTRAVCGLLKPDGTIVAATVNRTKRSFLLAVAAAEYVLGWVPPGTHDWDRFVRPSELAGLWEKEGLAVTDCSGVVFRPFSGRFEIEKGRTAVNYFLTGRKS